jgi:hypothetical protein
MQISTRVGVVQAMGYLPLGHLEQCRFSPRDWLPVRIDSYFRV